MACDVTDSAQIDAVVKATAEAFGGISTLVNNVGWGGRQPDPAAIPDDEFVASYKLNTISAYRMSMACLPYLEKAENASITNSGSFSSAVPAYDILPYATAKAALNQMMVSLAHMLNKRVRVNSILIGTVMTAGYGDAGISPEMQEAGASRQPHRPPRPPGGHRQRHALALLPRRGLGQRADDQRPRRRRRRAAVRAMSAVSPARRDLESRHDAPAPPARDRRPARGPRRAGRRRGGLRRSPTSRSM
jgi:NAD(P)-dependent dehydrogenase (short-subunit alcohol dehydrogenase family)